MRDYLPLLFLLVCPVAMLWMMRGMGHGSVTARADSEPDPRVAALEEELARLRAANPRHAEAPAERVLGRGAANHLQSAAPSQPRPDSR